MISWNNVKSEKFTRFFLFFIVNNISNKRKMNLSE